MAVPSFEDSLVSGAGSVRDLIESLNRTSKKIALVVDGQRKLLGTVTDGDIRRALLRGASLETVAQDVAQKHFQSLPAQSSPREARRYMRLHQIDQVPLVDENGIVSGLEFLANVDYSDEKPNTVVIMAGGLGMRLRPLTDHMPKPMIPVGGKPMLEWILTAASEDGFRNFVLAVNYLGEQIEEYFGDGKDFGVEITYVKEEEPLGTAGALSLLSKEQTDSVIVLNGDVLMQARLSEMLEFHRAEKADMTLGVKVLDTQIPFGVVSLQGSYVEEIREKPVYRDYVNAGIYVMEPQILRTIPRMSHLDMPDLISQVLADRRVLAFPLHESWIDLGRRSDLEQAESELFRPPWGATTDEPDVD